MNENRGLMATFARAADRQAHERSRLSKSQRDQLARAIKAARKTGFERLEQARVRQDDRREADLARERATISAQKWRLELKPPDTPQTRRIDLDRLDKLAAVEVDARNAAEVAVIKAEMRQEVSAAIDSFLGRQPEFAAERQSVDLARARWSELRAATHVLESERGDDGHER